MFAQALATAMEKVYILRVRTPPLPNLEYMAITRHIAMNLRWVLLRNLYRPVIGKTKLISDQTETKELRNCCCYIKLPPMSRSS